MPITCRPAASESRGSNDRTRHGQVDRPLGGGRRAGAMADSLDAAVTLTTDDLVEATLASLRVAARVIGHAGQRGLKVGGPDQNSNATLGCILAIGCRRAYTGFSCVSCLMAVSRRRCSELARSTPSTVIASVPFSCLPIQPFSLRYQT